MVEVISFTVAAESTDEDAPGFATFYYFCNRLGRQHDSARVGESGCMRRWRGARVARVRSITSLMPTITKTSNMDVRAKGSSDCTLPPLLAHSPRMKTTRSSSVAAWAD